MTKTMPPLPPTIAANIDRFTGRTWLLPSLLDWLDHGDQRIFLLTGAPGAGKSMVAAWLAGTGPLPAEDAVRQQLARLRSQIKAVHYCVAASGSTDPKELARQIAVQFTRNVPGFGQALTATMGDLVQITVEQKVDRVETDSSVTGVYIAHFDLGGLSEELSFNRILRDPMKRLYEDGYKEPMVLLIDALDEALTYGGRTNIVDLLTKLTDLPPQVRILATTRPEPRVTKLFRDVPQFDLIKDAPKSVDDVKQYVLERLSAQDGLEEEKRTLLATRLSEKAGGIFLYAHMVLSDLLPRLPQIPDLETYPLPEGLTGLYSEFLNRELGKDEDRWYESFRPVMGLIAVAQGDGLTRTQLAAISGVGVDRPLRTCKQYLTGELPEGPFRVFHESFREFLLKDGSNIDYHIDSVEMHAQIADYYWRKHSANWLQSDSYGLTSLAAHLTAAADFDRLRALINSRWMTARFQLDGYVYDGFIEDVVLAWKEAHGRAAQQVAASSVPTALADCVRYALIRTSINSLASRYDPFLIVGAVVTGLWSASRAISVANRISDAEQRADALIYLLATDRLQPGERSVVQHSALQAILGIGDSSSRAIAFGELACVADAEMSEQLTQAEPAALAGISDKWIGIFVGAALIRHGPHELRESRRREANTYFDELCDSQRFLGPAFGISREDREDAGISVELVWAPGGRARALAALLPYLDGSQREKAVVTALDFVQKSDIRRYMLSTLAILAPNVPDGRSHDFLRLVRDGTTWWSSAERCTAIASVLGHMRGDQREELQTELLRARARIEEKLQDLAPTVRDASEQIAALASLSLGSPSDAKEQLQATALDVLAEIREEFLRVLSIAILTPIISARKLATELADEAARWLISSGPVRNLGLVDDFEPPSWWWPNWIDRLVAILPFLSDEVRKQAVATGFRVARETWGIKQVGPLLAALVPHVGEDAREALLQDAIRMVLNMEDPSAASVILAKLARQLETDSMSRAASLALQAAASERIRVKQATKLALLVPHLSPDVRNKTVSEIIQLVNSVLPFWQRAVPLTLILSYLEDRVKQKAQADALQAAGGINDSMQRARLLFRLALCLGGTERQTAVENCIAAAREIAEEKTRARLFAELLPIATVPVRRELLQDIRQTICAQLSGANSHQERAKVLWFLADRTLLGPAVLTPGLLANIAEQVVEVCRGWQWL